MWTDWSVLQKVYFVIAMLFSLILVVQMILMLVGVGNGDTDVDLDGDGTPDVTVDGDSGLALFTVKGLVAFFAVGGWVGFALGDGMMKTVWVILISLASGLVALVVVGLLMKWISSLAENGNIDIGNAVGKTADVYLTIPAGCSAAGKITVELQGKLTEVEAMTEGEEIKTGTKVKIIRADGDTLIVEKLYPGDRGSKLGA